MFAYLPEIFIIGTGLILLLVNTLWISTFKNNFPIVDKEAFSQIIIILIYLILIIFNLQITSSVLTALFIHNTGSKLIKLIIIFFSILISYLILPIFIAQKLNFFEFFFFYLYSILSFLLMSSATNLMSFYLVIELQALCFYVLASFMRNSAFSTEAGLKYFILNSFMSGFFLLGTFFLYCTLGTLNLLELFTLLIFNLDSYVWQFKTVVFLGISFISSTILFKLACAPFHFWAPDVYEGAPLSSTIIFSILPKISLIFFFCKFIFSLGFIVDLIQPFLLFVGVFSCFIGTINSLYQQRIKRLIIFSSIAQIGFIVAGLALNSISGLSSVFMFLIIYSITSILIWGHIVCFYYFNFKTFSFHNLLNNVLILTHLTGFFIKNKTWTLSLIIIFFSVAGIPPFTGFLSKVVVLLELVAHNKIITSIALIIISSLSVFYYLRVVKIFFFEPKKLLTIKNENFQVVFFDNNLKYLYFIFVFLLINLIITLFFPTKIYLFCQYTILRTLF